MIAGDNRIRCAIYTRKSTEEGLDQAFNSLDAQREACEAYILSQRHEGWRPVSKRYDDGGYSGGSLERPALDQLMADIDAGQIGMVVVYKIDRLTRSLSDFSKLIEKLDAADCSFVSVTQAFNTSSSMGRLTLNVLLSFAQFEREVTAERIRDKIAASKRRGMWMGGLVPMGYSRDDSSDTKRLKINDEEADAIRFVYNQYDRTPCLSDVGQAVREAGILSKRRYRKNGVPCGGRPLKSGQIHFILTNPIYAGRVRHRDKIYDGQHDAIIERALFERVQDKLKGNARKPRGTVSATGRFRAPLAGRLFDESGDRLSPSQTRGKSGSAHRYYVSRRLMRGNADESGWRLPAAGVEESIRKLVADHLVGLLSGRKFLKDPASEASERVAKFGSVICKLSTADLCLLVDRGELRPGRLKLELDGKAIAERLAVAAEQISPASLELSAPFKVKRRGVESRIIAGELRPVPDQKLVSTLAKAHQWVAQMKAGKSAADIAILEKTSDSFIRVRASLAFLSPRIQDEILAGTQPPDLSLERIVRSGIPRDWYQQERKFGFLSTE
jgi:DNA invertase Pin-like site-specific DNA recombinase